MNLFTITILTALLYIVYRITGKFANRKNSTEIFIEELNAKYENVEISTPKEVKEKVIKADAPVDKPKRKYKKKPKTNA
jgi:hypothetical protein